MRAGLPFLGLENDAWALASSMFQLGTGRLLFEKEKDCVCPILGRESLSSYISAALGKHDLCMEQ